MLAMIPKVPVHVPKYQSHKNLEMHVDPTTYAHSFPLLIDKLSLKMLYYKRRSHTPQVI